MVATACLCLLILLNIDLCQTRIGRRYDKTNIRWQEGSYSDLLILQDHTNLVLHSR